MPDEPALSGWGRTFRPGRELRSEDLPAITRKAELTRGLGRSYGDASLPLDFDSRLACSTLADRVLAFDPETGVLRAEAGLSLAEIIRIFLPRGFFMPVTPGTKHVTLGGIVASDVHGKNHHVAGTLGRYVRSLRMRLADDRLIECSPRAGARAVLRHAGRHGSHWPHPRGRADARARALALHLHRELPLHATWTSSSRRSRARARAGPSRWAGSTRSRAAARSAAGSSTAAAGPSPVRRPLGHPRQRPCCPCLLRCRPACSTVSPSASSTSSSTTRTTRPIHARWSTPDSFFYPLDRWRAGTSPTACAA